MSFKVFSKLPLFALAPLAVAQVQLQFAPQGTLEPANYSRVIQLPGATPLLVGSYSAPGLAAGIDSGTTPIFSGANPHWQIQLTAPGPNPSQFLMPLPKDSGNDEPLATFPLKIRHLSSLRS